MINKEMKPITNRRHRWLLLSATALTLSLVGATTQAQAAETAATSGEDQAQREPVNDLQADEVTLTPSTATVSDDAVAPAAPVTETVTPAETPATDTAPVPETVPDTDGTSAEVTDDVSTPNTDETPTTEPETAVPSTPGLADAPATVNARVAPLVQNAVQETAPATAAVTMADDVTPAEETIDQWMPNQTLQKVILKWLNSTSTDGRKWASVSEITKEDLARLTRISEGDITYIDGETEFSIQGLEYAVNLKELMLQSRMETQAHGDLVDLSPLANLQFLEDLQLAGNRIKDVTPLAGLKSLKKLGLVMNQITDFSPLQGNQYQNLSTGQQVVFLPPVYVSKHERTAHLVNPFILADGSRPEMSAGRMVGNLIKFGNRGPEYHIYYTGGTATTVADGLDYTDIPDQVAGPTSDASGVVVVPLADKYFLTGKVFDATGTAYAVVQPYVLYDADVTAHYVDETGQTIADDELVYGMAGDPYTTTQKALDGYTFKEVQGQPTGTLVEGSQTVTYVYTENVTTGTVTVHYVDEAGTVLHAPVTLTGDLDTAYTTSSVTIDDYELVETPANATGTFTAGNQDVTYVYAPITTGTVTVHYVDEAGTVLRAPDLLTGDFDAAYTTTPATLEGYKLVETPANATGTFAKGNQDVTYVYAQLGAGTVTVHYVDEAGTVLHASDKLSGDEATAYTTTPRQLDGYTLLKTPANATGTYTAANQDVVYVYRAVNDGGNPGGGDNGGNNGGNNGGDTNTGGDNNNNNGGDLVDPGDTDGNEDVNTGGAGDGSPSPTKPSQPVKPDQQPDILNNGGAAAGGLTAGDPTTLTTGRTRGGQAARGLTTTTDRQAAAAATTLPQTDERTSQTGLWGVLLLGLSGLAFWRRRS